MGHHRGRHAGGPYDRGTLNRRVIELALATGLPPETFGEDWRVIATVEELLERRWSPTEELLASILEELDVLNRNFMRANIDKPENVPDFGPPLKVNRPNAVEVEDKPKTSVRELFAALAGSRRRG